MYAPAHMSYGKLFTILAHCCTSAGHPPQPRSRPDIISGTKLLLQDILNMAGCLCSTTYFIQTTPARKPNPFVNHSHSVSPLPPFPQVLLGWLCWYVDRQHLYGCVEVPIVNLYGTIQVSSPLPIPSLAVPYGGQQTACMISSNANTP